MRPSRLRITRSCLVTNKYHDAVVLEDVKTEFKKLFRNGSEPWVKADYTDQLVKEENL